MRNGQEKYDMAIAFLLDMDGVTGLGVRSACNIDRMKGNTKFKTDCVEMLVLSSYSSNDEGAEMPSCL